MVEVQGSGLNNIEAEVVQVDGTKERYCSKCGNIKELSEFNRGQYWCRKCQQAYNKTDAARTSKAKWASKNKEHLTAYNKVYKKTGQFIYMLWNDKGECIYAGSSSNRYRVYEHLNSHSQLKLDQSEWSDLGLVSYTYADLEEFGLSEGERYYIEGLFIDMHRPIFNKQRAGVAIAGELDSYREVELDDLFHRGLISFKEVLIDIEQLAIGEVTGKEVWLV